MIYRRRQPHSRPASGTRRPRVARIRPGTPPGTLIASDSAEAPVVRVVSFGRNGLEEELVR